MKSKGILNYGMSAISQPRHLSYISANNADSGKKKMHAYWKKKCMLFGII